MAVELGKVLSPAPARTAVNLKKESIVREVRLAVRKVRREMREDKAGKEAQEKALKADEKRRVEALESVYWRGVLVQAETVKTLARLLPSGCLIHALMGLAGTDVRYVSDFQAAHGRVKSAYEASIKHPQPERQYGTGLAETHGIVSPTFDIPHRNLGERLEGVLLDIGLLAGYLIVLFVATYLGFLRYDIR